MIGAVVMDGRGPERGAHGGGVEHWAWVLLVVAVVLVVGAVAWELAAGAAGSASFDMTVAAQQDWALGAAAAAGLLSLVGGALGLVVSARVRARAGASARPVSFSARRRREAMVWIRQGRAVPEEELEVARAVACALVGQRWMVVSDLGLVAAVVAVSMFLDSWWWLVIAGAGVLALAVALAIFNRGGAAARHWLAEHPSPVAAPGL